MHDAKKQIQSCVFSKKKKKKISLKLDYASLQNLMTEEKMFLRHFQSEHNEKFY